MMEYENAENTLQELIPDTNAAIESYQEKVIEFLSFCEELKIEADLHEERLQLGMESLDFGVHESLQKIEEISFRDKSHEEQLKNELLSEITNYEAMLTNNGLKTQEKETSLLRLRQAIDFAYLGKTEEIDRLFEENKKMLTDAPEEKKAKLLTEFEEKKLRLQAKYDERIEGLLSEEEQIFNLHYETAFTEDALNISKMHNKSSQASVNIGWSDFELDLFGKNYQYSFYHFLSFFSQKNLLLKNYSSSVSTIMETINCLVGRLLMSHQPGNLNLHMVDTMGKGKNFRKFSKLTPTVKSIYTDEKDIEKLFKQLDKKIGHTFQNILADEYETLFDYNQSHEEKKNGHLLVLFYPERLSKSLIKKLQMIVENGPVAGINTIAITEMDEEKVKVKKSVKKLLLEQLFPYCNIIDIKNGLLKSKLPVQPVNFFGEAQIDISGIIKYINNNIDENI